MIFEKQINKIRRSKQIPHHTARKVMTIFYFFLTIVSLCTLCALLLALPFSQKEPTELLNVIFTAISTITLTGMTTVNTAATWTPTGLTIIIICTQLAAITYIILAANVAVEVGAKLKQDFQSGNPLLNINKNSNFMHKDFLFFAKFVIIFIFIIEIIGALLFFIYYSIVSPTTMAGNIFASIFNSISGLCNSGLSLYNSENVGILGLNVPPIAHNIPQMLIFTVLAILGGLGFVVIYDLLFYRVNKRLSLHTKLTLVTTLIFLIVGTAIFYVYELSLMHIDAPLGASNKLSAFVSSIFVPVSARGLGLSCIDMSALSAPAFFFIALLMFIGGAPGSMTSGIKITTVAIIVLSIIAQLRRKPDIEIFKRRISPEAVRFALTVVMVSLIFIMFAVFLVTLAESRQMAVTGAEVSTYSNVIFLIISAYSNIGYEPGIVSALTPISKSIIIIIMLLGRISSVLFFYVFATPATKQLRRYPTEPILEG